MVEELKKKVFEYLHELPQKKEELEQLQQQSHSEHLSKQQLLAENESLKVEMGNLRTQLDFTNKVLHRCEESLKAAKNSEVKHKLGLEATSRIGDKMKEEAVKIHSENLALKKQIEQLEKEMKTECYYRESCMSKQSKMQTTIESLTNQMRSLEKDFRDVERKSNTTLSIGNKSKLALENKNHIIKQMQEKIESLTAQNISLTSEIKTLQLNGSKDKAADQDYIQEILKEWQISVNEMKNRKQTYEKEAETLYNSLEMALKDIKRFQEFEQIANEKVRELEAALEAAKGGDKKMSTDCSVQTDLTMSIEVGCQTEAGVDNSATRSDCSQNQHTSSSTSSAVEKLIFKFQRERAKQQSTEANSETLSQSAVPYLSMSELPTQPNITLNQK